LDTFRLGLSSDGYLLDGDITLFATLDESQKQKLFVNCSELKPVQKQQYNESYIKLLENYIESRKAVKTEYIVLLGWVGYSRSKKIDAAKSIIEKLKHSQSIIYEGLPNEARQGFLGKIMACYHHRKAPPELPSHYVINNKESASSLAACSS